MGFKAICRVSVVLVVFVACTLQFAKLAIHNYNENLSTSAFYGFLTFVLGVLSVVCLDIILLNPADSFTWIQMLDHYCWYTGLIGYGWWLFRWLEGNSKDVTTLLESNLMKMIELNKDTAYGKDIGLDKVKNSADLRKIVPLATYAEIKDYVELLKEGDLKAFTNDTVQHIVYTSGTTGNKKWYPHTSFYPLPQAKAVREYNVYRRVGRSMGRTLMLFHTYSPVVKDTTKIPIQTMSSVAYGQRRFWTNPYEVFTIVEERSFFYASAVFALQERELDSMKTIFAFMMHSFWIVVSNNWKQICDNVEKGHIDRGTLKVDDETLKKINSNLTPDPERAEELRKEFRKGLFGIAKRIWPRLLYVDMVCTGALALPAKLLRENQLNGIPFLTLFIAATETICGYNTDNDMAPTKFTLFPVDQYFEWISELRVHETNPETVDTVQVKVGESYELVVTTFSGLNRYRTGDVLKCVDKYNQSPVFVFCYRSGQLLDLAGEKITEEIFYNNLMTTCEQLGIQLCDYTCTSNRNMTGVKPYLDKYQDPTVAAPHYLLFFEVTKDGKPIFLSKEERAEFDKNLRKRYDLYDDLRNNGALGEMNVFMPKEGTFQELKSRIIHHTKNPTQFKMPRVMGSQINLEFLMTQLNA